MRASRATWCVGALVALAGLYALAAYVVAPDAWRSEARRDPALDAMPGVTRGADGLPGDPLNLLLHGSGDTLRAAMAAAGWSVADALDLRDDARIVADTLARRAYADAPVSRLCLFGRAQDVAFEMPIGDDPARRHHVRFWCVVDTQRRACTRWIGAASLDRSVGLASTTGQVTHHIAPDVDAERDHVLDSLERAGRLDRRRYVEGFHRVRSGRNAGGDPWVSDGRLGEGRLR